MTADPHAPDAPDAAADRATAPADPSRGAPRQPVARDRAGQDHLPVPAVRGRGLAQLDRRPRAPLHRGLAAGAARGREAAPALPDRLPRRVRHLRRRDRGAVGGASRDDDPPPGHPHDPGRPRPRPPGRRHPGDEPLPVGRAGRARRPARGRLRRRPGRPARLGRRIVARRRRRAGVGEPGRAARPAAAAATHAATPKPTPTARRPPVPQKTVAPSPTLVPTEVSPSPSASDHPASYTVKRGDTLSGIAATYGTTVKKLAALNEHRRPVEAARRPGPEAALSRPRRARQRWQPRQYDVMNPPARTSVIFVPHRGHAWPPLSWTARKSRTCFSNVGGTRVAQDVDRRGQGRPRRVVERVHLLGRQAGPLAEGQEPGRVEDLVAVGVADAGDERLVAEQVLELARVAPDPLAPDVEGEGRVVRVGALVLAAQPGDRPVDPGGLEVDLAHLGRVPVADLGGRVVRGHPGGPRRPRGRVARTLGARPSNPSTTAVLPGCFSFGSASWKRPVSIGLTTMRVALEVQEQELAPPADRGQALPDEGLQLGRRAADRERGDRGRRADRPAGEARMERLGDDRQVGQFGHSRPIVADCWARKPCARLSRPSGPPTAEERRASPIAHEGADRGVDHHGPLDRIGDGLSVARAVRDSGAKSMTGAPIS